MSEEEIVHEFTNEIVCPHCGYKYSDSWEFDNDESEISCENCNKEFVYYRNIEITYTTAKV